MKKNYLRVVLYTTLLILSFQTSVYSQQVIKILAIGNSFSQDAAEAYLDDLATASGIKLIVGNAYIAGCSLETHWNNANENLVAYSYRKINEGDSATFADKTLLSCITDENWDYITFQQASPYSGLYNTYFPYLTNLIQYVKNNATNPNAKFALHQTWAYAANSTHTGFSNYSKDQTTMYNAIVDANNRASAEVGIDIIIPAGTAIQNGRSSFIGDNFCRDGHHLSLGLGRYTAACTWFEKIFNKPVIDHSFIPKNVSATEAKIAQYAAHYAILNPNSVTSLVDLIENTTTELKFPINIDFGSTVSSGVWNNLTSPTEGCRIMELLDMNGNNTKISIDVNDAFTGVNASGETATNTELNMPNEVSSDCFYGNAGAAFSGKSEPTGGFLISNLSKNTAYNFTVYGSRYAVTDNRETLFTAKGQNEGTTSFNASNNSSVLGKVNNIVPKEDGTISIILGAGTSNNNSYKFFYINALQIAPSPLSGINDVHQSTTTHTYPNPFYNVINIASTTPIKKVYVNDMLGKRLGEYNGEQITILDLGTLSTGIYILKMIDENNNVSTSLLTKKHQKI